MHALNGSVFMLVKNISKSSFQHNVFEWFNPKIIYSFKFTEIDPQKILTSLSKLSTESNIDILEFGSKLLQIASHVIYNSLSALFDESLKGLC